MRKAWRAFGGHRKDCRPRTKTSQPPPSPESTSPTPERIDALVPNFARRAVHPAPQFSVQNNAATYACPQSHTDDGATAATSSLPHFTHRCGVGVVLQNGRAM